MAKLRIRDFGPIGEGVGEDGGFLSIAPITVICGNQATGKSVIAKFYSLFSWLEKALVRGSLAEETFSDGDFRGVCESQRIADYFHKGTLIEYQGEAYSFCYKDGSIKRPCRNLSWEKYSRPKVMYVPSERNLLSVIVKAQNMRNLPPMLSIMQERYMESLQNMGGTAASLPVSNMKVQYDDASDTVRVASGDGALVKISDASSGIQSVAPLSIVTRYLSSSVTSDIAKNIQSLSARERNAIKDNIRQDVENQSLAETLLDEFDTILKTGRPKEKPHGEDNANLSVLKSRLRFYFNECFINIVEEPEQNLYPSSQGKVLYELIECFNKNENNSLLMTTHSPYILSYLTLAAKAAELLKKGVSPSRIDAIVPSSAAVSGGKIAIYETQDDGTVRRVPPYFDGRDGSVAPIDYTLQADVEQPCEGVPSDNNLLNNAMAQGNEDFARLLEMEDELCR